jgi:two-component system sensor histidine kinase CpxA
MRSLFLKIFLRFWLTAVLVGVAIALSILYSVNRLQAERRAIASELLKQDTNTFAEVFETSGTRSLAAAFKRLEAAHSIIAFLLGPDGREALGRNPPPEVREVAKVVRRSDEPFIGGGYAGQRQTGPSGQLYSLVLVVGGPPNVKAIIASAFVFQLPVISLIGGGLFCYLITRHITTPLSRLRRATADLAEGRLDARVGASLGRRRDEIAALGHDFDRMAERIEALVTGQRRMLGDVSHELRSPLSRLLVALSLVKQRVGPGSGIEDGPTCDAHDHLDRIALEAHRLDALIGQLLTLSRIDSGLQIGERSAIDLMNLVHEVASDGDFEGRARGRRVVVMAADACTIFGFEELIRSALENVVRNAIRHTPDGTSVEISLERPSGPDGRAVLRVRDHGPGVPEAMLADMFLPFRRVPDATEQTDGAGLGLAITERAVSVHGGTVRAMNAVGGGLIVEIRLRNQT